MSAGFPDHVTPVRRYLWVVAALLCLLAASAGSGFIWLAMLLGLTLLDFLTRAATPAP